MTRNEDPCVWWICRHCKRAYPRRKYLRKHKKDMHPEYMKISRGNDEDGVELIDLDTVQQGSPTESESSSSESQQQNEISSAGDSSRQRQEDEGRGESLSEETSQTESISSCDNSGGERSKRRSHRIAIRRGQLPMEEDLPPEKKTKIDHKNSWTNYDAKEIPPSSSSSDEVNKESIEKSSPNNVNHSRPCPKRFKNKLNFN